MSMLNVRYRRVGGIRFLRLGRLQFSFCLCQSFNKAEKRAHSPRLAPVIEARKYPAGSTVVVYADR
jgi:hypothetical protein